MGDRGFTQGQVRIDYSIACVRCGQSGVVVDPKRNRPGKICAGCFISAMSELFLLSEAHDILTGQEEK